MCYTGRVLCPRQVWDDCRKERAFELALVECSRNLCKKALGLEGNLQKHGLLWDGLVTWRLRVKQGS